MTHKTAAEVVREPERITNGRAIEICHSLLAKLRYVGFSEANDPVSDDVQEAIAALSAPQGEVVPPGYIVTRLPEEATSAPRHYAPMEATAYIAGWNWCRAGVMAAENIYTAQPAQQPANLGEFVIALLIAGGYVTQAKVDEARKIALGVGPYEMPAQPPGEVAVTDEMVEKAAIAWMRSDFINIPGDQDELDELVRLLLSAALTAALTTGGRYG